MEAKADKTILVTGATGRQGGAVTRHLVAAGWRVRALSRDPNRPQGQALAKLGAEVVPGDLDDFASLTRALFDRPGEFLVRALELAGDEKPMSEVVELFGRLLGREIAFEELPLDRLRETSLEAAAMFDWFRREGYRADIDYLRRLHPRLLTLRD
jgi:uncharacterized protein YbjT (DUF2867 family)